MANIIDKDNVTLDDVLDSKSLKALSNEELEDLLEGYLAEEHFHANYLINMIIAELLNRGDEGKKIVNKEKSKMKEELKKSFDALSFTLDALEVLEKGGKKPIGYISPDGKWRKVAEGKWEPVKSGTKEAHKHEHKEEDKKTKKQLEAEKTLARQKEIIADEEKDNKTNNNEIKLAIDKIRQRQLAFEKQAHTYSSTKYHNEVSQINDLIDKLIEDYYGKDESVKKFINELTQSEEFNNVNLRMKAYQAMNRKDKESKKDISELSKDAAKTIIDKSKESLKNNEGKFSTSDLKKHVNANEKSIRNNMKTYGFNLNSVKLIRNYVDFASVLGIDSRLVKDVELPIYTRILVNLLEEEDDD